MSGEKYSTAILHYSAPPVVGGVEAVMLAHARVLLDAGYPVRVVAGRGEQEALPRGVELALIPELDSQHPRVLALTGQLDQGRMPAGFEELARELSAALKQALAGVAVLIVHNVMTKHFNLPLTAALVRLIETGEIPRAVAWCHDMSWTSPSSRSKVFPGYPWDLLRTPAPGMRYVAVSEQRLNEMTDLLKLPPGQAAMVYNGVDPVTWYGLSPAGWDLVDRLDLLSGDLILLMPVRVTRAKNIELALRVAAALKSGGLTPRLVVTGPPDPHQASGPDYYQSLLDLRVELGLEQEVRFVYESGPEGQTDYIIPQETAADLMRVSDALLMTSHREGFGMPVLEAGLVGMPVVASRAVPAAVELGRENVYLFDPQAAPEEIAHLIVDKAVENRAMRFRREVRQHYTWMRLFEERIEPLLHGGGEG